MSKHSNRELVGKQPSHQHHQEVEQRQNRRGKRGGGSRGKRDNESVGETFNISKKSYQGK
jgi:hypothetical protein